MNGSRMRDRRAVVLPVGLALMLALVLTACNTSNAPTRVTVDKVGTINWLAYQDGTGAWQQLTGSSFPVSDSAGRYGVAWECPSPITHGPGVGVIQATTAESTAVLAGCPPTQPTTTYTISGTLSGIPSGGTAVISLGSASASVTAASPGFTLNPVPSGIHTLVAYSLDSGGAPGTMVVSRNVTINSNDSSYNVDLTSGQTFVLDTAQLTNTPSNLSTSSTNISAFLVSTGEGINRLATSSPGSATVTYPVLPASLSQSSDLYELSGSSNPPVSSGTTSDQVAMLSHDPSNGQSVALPAPISSDATLTVSASTTTVTWGTAAFTGSGGLTVHSATDDSLTGASWIVAVTAGWNGSTATYTFPDFTSVTGWNTAWNPPAASNVALSLVHALHANLSLEPFEVFYLDGGTTSAPDGTLVQSTAH